MITIEEKTKIKIEAKMLKTRNFCKRRAEVALEIKKYC